MNQAAASHAANDDDLEPLIGLARLMRMAYAGIDLAPVGAQLIARANRNPDDANALMDLSTVLQLRGDRELALNMQAQALQLRQVYRPPTSSRAAVRLLAVMGPGDLMSNTPLEFLLEDSDVTLDLLYLAPDIPSPPYLPEHDVLFVAIGESEQNLPVLQIIQSVVSDWPHPVLNQPQRIAALSRDNAGALLELLPGVVMPATVRITRQALEHIAQGELPLDAVMENGAFPLIIRPVDSHAGRGLARLDEACAINGYLGAMAEQEFFISRFIDYRGTDGLFRKCRIVLVEGRPYACHLAISAHWMIHYLNAGMAESAEKRAEEERFMAGFDTGFAQRHAEAFRGIAERTQLDYLGIDCAETQDGELLIFEVDSNMIVHAIDPVEVFPYKQPQMRKVFAAFRGMLSHAMQRSPK